VFGEAEGFRDFLRKRGPSQLLGDLSACDERLAHLRYAIHRDTDRARFFGKGAVNPLLDETRSMSSKRSASPCARVFPSFRVAAGRRSRAKPSARLSSSTLMRPTLFALKFAFEIVPQRSINSFVRG